MFKKKEKSPNRDKNPIIIFKKISRVLIFLSIVLVLWVIIVASGSILMDMEPQWAYLSLENWVIFTIITILLFAIIEMLYYIFKIRDSNIIIEFQEAEPEKMYGKNIHIYTNPTGSKGGVFSKTYIQIDKDNYLRLRNQIIPPEEL
jgi:hypothetical protein